jgi:hypothetical protein
MAKIIDEFQSSKNPPVVMSDNLKFTSYIIDKSYQNEYRFDYLLSFLVMATWLKLFFSFRVTKVFGPMYKILFQMVLDLLKFLSIWVFVILMFTCMTLLAFSQIETFKSFPQTLTYFIQASTGNYDLDVFMNEPKDDGSDEDLESAEFLSRVGSYYMLVYLLINTVLMLNFVIAILGNSYSLYAQNIGIYYITVLEQFESMEFDDRYGAIACA